MSTVIERPKHIHLDPPTSAGHLMLGSTRRALVPLVLLVCLAMAAGLDGGSLLLHVDRPVSEWVVAHRTGALDGLFRRISFFGSTLVVFVGGALLALVALPRCRVTAAVVAGMTLARPLLETVLKQVVDRQRPPDFSRLVRGIGPSFPSGHVLAASVLWGMVPLVLALYITSRRVWWIAFSVAILFVVAIGMSRVYLGVHWPTDVLGAYLAGGFLVGGADLVLKAMHHDHVCRVIKQK